jgi:cell shape-determining protein MreC
MKKDTVLLSVEKYNALRDFKKQIEDGNVLVEYYSVGGFGAFSTLNKYYTDDEVAKELNNQKDNLKEEIKVLEGENKELKEKYEKRNEPKEITIEDIRKMIGREFRKWKRG